jgi:hypothetical protein
LPSLLFPKSFLRIFGGKCSLKLIYLRLQPQTLSTFFTRATCLHGLVSLSLISENTVKTREVVAGLDNLGRPDIYCLG